jgi:hypothetical protein
MKKNNFPRVIPFPPSVLKYRYDQAGIDEWSASPCEDVQVVENIESGGKPILEAVYELVQVRKLRPRNKRKKQ